MNLIMYIKLRHITNILNLDFAYFDKSHIHYVMKGLQHLFDFTENDDWNGQNWRKLL